MAYVDNSENTLLDANGNPLTLSNESGGNIGQGGISQIGTSNQASTGQNSGGPKGSGFVPIDKYVAANSNQIPQLANTLATAGTQKIQGIENQSGVQRDALMNILNNQKSNINNDQSFVNQSINNAINGGNLLNSSDLSNFQNIQAGKPEYNQSSIPQGDFSAQELQLNNYKNQDLLGNENARASFLQNTFGSGNDQYTQGAQTLDSALLQSNPTALNNTNQAIQSKVKEAGNQLNDIGSQISNQRNQDIQMGADLQNSASMNGQLGKAITGFNNNLNTQAGNYSNNIVNAGNTLKNELAQGYIDPTLFASLDPASQAQLQQLATNKTAIGNINNQGFLTNINPTGFTPVNGTYSAAQLGQAATPQDLATANALGQLTGSGNSWLPDTIGGGYTAAQTGLSNLAGDINDRNTAYQQIRDNLVNLSAKKLGTTAYNDYLSQIGAGDQYNPNSVQAPIYSQANLINDLNKGNSVNMFTGGNMLDPFRTQYSAQLAALQSLKDQYNANPFQISNIAPNPLPSNQVINPNITGPTGINLGLK